MSHSFTLPQQLCHVCLLPAFLVYKQSSNYSGTGTSVPISIQCLIKHYAIK